MMNREWWRAAGARAIRTIAQCAVGLLGSGAMGILDADWLGVLSCSLMAGIVSILTSISGGLPEIEQK